MGRYNEDYLNGLIAKAKKSWDGVDVDSFMNNLRDMETIKCKELMEGDLCRSEHGFPMQITNVGDDYAYATFEGFDWELDDKDFPPCAIEITKELLEANGWKVLTDEFCDVRYYVGCVNDSNGNYIVWKNGDLSIWFAYEENSDGVYADILVPCKYVHQLQRALRLAGLNEMANNFKVK